MRPAVTYTPYATSSKEQNGNVLTFAQFEEGDLLSETRTDTESSDEYDSESIVMSEQDMENLDEKERFDDDHISTETLQKIVTEIRPTRTFIKGKHVLKCMIALRKKKLEWKGALRATHKMGKGLHKVFSTIIKDILQELTNFGESAVYHVSLNC